MKEKLFSFMNVVIVVSWTFLFGEMGKKLIQNSILVEGTSTVCGASIGVVIIFYVKWSRGAK